MGADLIPTGRSRAQKERDEEAVDQLMDRWSDWIDNHTN